MSADSLGAHTPVGAVSPAPEVRGTGLKMVYRRRTVLDVPDVVLPAGKTYVLLGASGAGKSTLLRVLGLLERPTEGQVTFGGSRADGRKLEVRRQIAAVFQKPYLMRGSVADNVGYGLKLRGVARVERRDRVARALSRVGMAGWEERSGLTLSGGEAQRVALARALVLEPRLLLLDEPLSYMDPLLKKQLTLEFADILADQDLTTLYVTHDQDEAAVVADHIGVMRDGMIVTSGVPSHVLTLASDEWVATFLGVEQPIEGTAVRRDEGILEVDCSGTTIYALGHVEPGQRALLGVRPEDVVLLEPDIQIPVTSARNALPSTVTEVHREGALTRVVLESGAIRFSASVSHASAAAMRLQPGSTVNALFKATAVHARAV